MRRFSVVLVPLVAAAATLDLRVLDERGKPVAARVQLRNAQRAPLPIPGQHTAVNPRHLALGIVIPAGAARIDLPAGAATIQVTRGLEYHAEEFPATETSKTVRLRRWIDLARQGWWSGDTHVHRTPAEMPLLLEAADLHFAPAITRWNLNANVDSWPAQPFHAAGPDRAFSVDNSEDERPWGAALFFGVKTPMALYDRRSEYPLPLATWREARGRGAFIDQEKIIWWAAPALAALVPPDSIGVANNHFYEEGMMDNEAWGRPRDTARYPGKPGFAEYIFDLYYTYLSAGLRIPASAGSANGVLPNPIGYSRSYVHLGKRFTPQAWLAGQKAGRNFVTNGPLLWVTVEGNHPGATLRPGAVRVKVRARSRTTLEKVEVLLDGRVAATLPPESDATRIESETKVTAGDGSWLAVRAFEKNDATVRFAHTSPFWFGAKPRRDPAALRYLRDWLDAYRAHPPKELAGAQRDEWLAMLDQARARFQE